MPRKKDKPPNQREAVILQILVNGEKYGLEIRDRYEALRKQDLPLGSLYPTLDVMLRKGFLSARMAKSTSTRGGNRRRYYTLTASGHRALTAAQMLSDIILGRIN